MNTPHHAHEPKICERPRKAGGRVFYIEYCSGGRRKYHRAHPGLCTCKSSTDRRPCQHLMMAQEQMLGFMTKQLVPVANRNLALPEMFSRYVREHSLGQLEESSLKLKRYGQVYFLEYLEAVLWNGRSMDIDSKLLMGYKSWLMGIKRFSHCYTNILLRSLRTIFYWALREGYMNTNPLSGQGVPRHAKIVDRRPRNKRERNPLTMEEVRRIEAEADGWRRDMSMLSLYTGMRKGELINLPFAHVTQTCIRITEIEDWHPKQHERREIPLHPMAKEIIDRRRSQFPEARFVFETDTGTRYDPANVQRGFRSMFRRLKIVGEDGVGVTIHCFRHTFATRLLQEGVPPTAVRDILGHKDLETTMLYYHRLNRRNAEEISKLRYE